MSKNWEQAFLSQHRPQPSVLETLRAWNVEATSGHNDGWTQKHYRDKIEEVRHFLKTVPPLKERDADGE